MEFDSCFRCDENPFCTWYTWSEDKKLCYLKNQRGYLVNTTSSSDQFTSGATFRDGCEPDPPCSSPFTLHHHQCLHVPRQESVYSESIAVCESVGGHLTYSYEGWSGGGVHQDDWFWVNTVDTGAGRCYACRPLSWSLGVKRVPCDQHLHFACERRSLFPPLVPPRPRDYSVELVDHPAVAANTIEIINNVPFKHRQRRRRKKKPRSRQISFRNPFINLALG